MRSRTCPGYLVSTLLQLKGYTKNGEKEKQKRKARYMMNDKDLRRNQDGLRPKLVMKINK